MPRQSLGKVLSVAALLFVLSITSAQSRETREMCIAEKVESSDAVFVGKVAAIRDPDQKTPGMNKYAVVQVQDVLKGSAPKEVSFVVSGYSAELNPDCCVAGKTYLFFTKRGYDLFDMSGGNFEISTMGKDKFMSATNGRFSTFLLTDNKVVGWPQKSGCGAKKTDLKSDVYACIKKQTE